tara:strand:- start:1759 stop:2139 length:381 start_codon:yes stop_codon:yes gene_type:complete
MDKEKIEQYKEKRLDEVCKMIMRQTDYSYEESKDRLLKENYDYLKVIKKYVTNDGEQINKSQENQSKSVNQKIYSELRGFMDNTAEQYEKRKRKAEKVEEFKKQMAEEYERRQLAENQADNSTDNQ